MRSIARSLHILVIEDNHDVAEMLRVTLELSGHSVEVAYSGVAGVEVARRSRPDVVLCDIRLPDLDGYGVATELRRNPATTTARLIALSESGREEDRRRCREAGFDLDLTKPLDTAELEQLLKAG